MKYQTYDDLIALVADVRLKNNDLSDDELDKLVKKTFKIDQATFSSIDFKRRSVIIAL